MGYYTTAIITLLSAVFGLVFAILAVRKGKAEERTNALYMMARSLALVTISVIPIYSKNEFILVTITAAMLIVQIIDGIAGVYIKERMRTAGPFIMAVLHGICLWLYF